MSYIGNSPETNAAVNKYEYTATAGQTTFNCVYDSRVDVFLNGVLLPTGDYTATTGTEIVLLTGASLDDIINIDAFQDVANLPEVFTTDQSHGDNVKAKFGASDDLQIYHDGSNSYVKDTATGQLYLQGSDYVILGSATGAGEMLSAHSGAEVNLKYNNSNKLSTTSTGIDVTGSVTCDGITNNGDVVFSKSTTGVPTLKMSGFAGANSPYSIINFYNEDGSQQGPNNAVQIKALAKNSDGSGGELAFHTSTGTSSEGADAAERLRINSSGNVGIGTSSPGARLNVAGNLGSVIGGGASAIRMTNTDSSNYASISAGIVGNTNDGMDFSVDGTRRMVIKGSGNVGIGTTSPDTNLSLYHATDDTSINVNTGTAGTYPKKTGISFGATSTALGTDVQFRGGAGIQAINTASIGNPTDLIFWTSATGTPKERLRIDSSGRVTMPYQPYANASSNGTITATYGIPLNTNGRSRGGLTISGNRMTVPVAGAYVIGYHHLGNTSSGSCQIEIRVNNTMVGGSRTQDTDASNDSFGTQVIKELAASDYIEFYVVSGASHGNPSYNSMWAYLIG